MQYLLVGWDRHRLCRVDNAVNVLLKDLLIANGHNPVRIHRANVTAGDTHVNGVDLTARHQLGFLYRALYRIDRGFDIDHDTLFHTSGWMRADAHDLHTTIRVDLADNRDDLRGADIESDNHLLALLLSHYPSPLFCAPCIASSASLNVTAAPYS